MSKTIIIAGMHRSGTSLCAALVQSMGVDIGTNLVGPSPSNPMGHFENQEFMELNEDLLKAAGGSWCNPPSEQDIERTFQENLPRIRETIRRNQRSDRPWGWKDPRNSLFLSHYIELVDNPVVIVCLRKLHSTVESLMHRDKFDERAAGNLAQKYYDTILRDMAIIEDRGITCTKVFYESWFMPLTRHCQGQDLACAIGVENEPDYSIIHTEYRHF